MNEKPITNTRYDLWETIEEYAARVKRHNDRVSLWHACNLIEYGHIRISIPDAVFYADKGPEFG